MEPNEILKRPYARVLTPEPDGQYTAEIMEFPNCVASGDDAADALSKLEQVASDWIAAALEQGQDIPDPLDNADYSGRLVLRMPRGLHRRAALLAEREGASLNQFIVTCLAEAVGEKAKPQPAHSLLQVQATASVTFQVVGTSAGLSNLLQGSPARQITTAVAGPAVLPIQWRELERQHA